MTTMRMATTMATPSTQSTEGSVQMFVGGHDVDGYVSGGVPRSWYRPSASETTAATERMMRTLSCGRARRERQ